MSTLIVSRYFEFVVVVVVVFCHLVVLVRLSVQVIDWERLVSQMTCNVLMGDVKTYSLTHSLVLRLSSRPENTPALPHFAGTIETPLVIMRYSKPTRSVNTASHCTTTVIYVFAICPA